MGISKYFRNEALSHIEAGKIFFNSRAVTRGLTEKSNLADKILPPSAQYKLLGLYIAGLPESSQWEVVSRWSESEDTASHFTAMLINHRPPQILTEHLIDITYAQFEDDIIDAYNELVDEYQRERNVSRNESMYETGHMLKNLGLTF